MDVTRRGFFSLTGAAALGAATLMLSGCGGSRGDAGAASVTATSSTQASASSPTSAAAASTAPAANAASDSVVIYFSHTGENYGVGFIEEGNTAIVAKMIAESTGADLFEIVPIEAYPEGYNACCDVALAEQNAKARPAYTEDIDISSYKTVYLGYPIWWGDLPMCLYTFLEAHSWDGKEIRPFCTHAGSGLSGTVGSVQTTCVGANVGQGLSIEGTTAQNSRDKAQSAVNAWLG